jgi:hypothetical protein
MLCNGGLECNFLCEKVIIKQIMNMVCDYLSVVILFAARYVQFV